MSPPAPALLREVPAEVRFVLGDRHYNTPDLHEVYELDDRLLVTTTYGRYPTPMMASRCDAASISCVPAPMRIVMNTSKGSLMDRAKFPTFGLLATQRFADGGRSLSLNWL